MPSLKVPRPPFLYTLDQLAQCLNLTEARLTAQYIRFDNRTAGPIMRGKMTARNITNDPSEDPDWRVTDAELARWLKFKGYAVNFDRWF